MLDSDSTSHSKEVKGKQRDKWDDNEQERKEHWMFNSGRRDMGKLQDLRNLTKFLNKT